MVKQPDIIAGAIYSDWKLPRCPLSTFGTASHQVFNKLAAYMIWVCNMWPMSKFLSLVSMAELMDACIMCTAGTLPLLTWRLCHIEVIIDGSAFLIQKVSLQVTVELWLWKHLHPVHRCWYVKQFCCTRRDTWDSCHLFRICSGRDSFPAPSWRQCLSTCWHHLLLLEHYLYSEDL